MTHSPRIDGVDTWHHVMNRGIARRVIFENEADIRMFLSRVAHAVRAKQIEVHSYCVLSTHFHMLVRSPRGELSAAMQSIQNEFSRWFNRARHRDGPLFRSRFRSRRVTTLAYRRRLVRYIDANPVQARLVEAPSQYPYGSASCYARSNGPIWLSREWIESVVIEATGATVYEPRSYSAAFGATEPSALAHVVEKQLERFTRAQDPLDDLLDEAPDRVLEWMKRKAMLADGTSIGLPVCEIQTVTRLVDEARSIRPSWRVGISRKSVDAWAQIQAGLLREFCGATWSQIGERMSASGTGARKCHARHCQVLEIDPAYAGEFALLARRVLDHCRS